MLFGSILSNFRPSPPIRLTHADQVVLFCDLESADGITSIGNYIFCKFAQSHRRPIWRLGSIEARAKIRPCGYIRCLLTCWKAITKLNRHFASLEGFTELFQLVPVFVFPALLCRSFLRISV
jgi:hypothetical protein